MFDQWFYTIPANTAQVDSIRHKCKISSGVITEMAVDFPAGCQYLARCRVFLGEKPIFPRSPKNYIAANKNMIVARNMSERVKEDIPELTWELWNLDNTYSHTLFLYCQWISDEEIPERATALGISELVDMWKKVLRLE